MKFRPFNNSENIGFSGNLSKRGFFRLLFLLLLSGTVLLGPLCEVFRGEERQKILKAQGDNSYPPYEYLENGIPTGFNVDIMQALAKELQFPVQIELDDWDIVRQRLEKGEIDMLMGMFYSPERDLSVDFSTPHIMVTNAIFSRKGSPLHSLEDLYGKEILVQKGDIMHDYALQEKLSSFIFPVTNPREALRELAKGKYDAALLARLQGLQILHEEGFTNLTNIPIDVLPRKYCIAFPEGREDLRAKINDGLRILKENGTYDAIYNKWFGLLVQPTLSLREVLRQLFWILLPLMLLVGMVIFWNRSLRRQVRLQTEQLRQELLSRERAEDSLRTLVNTLPDIVSFRDGEGCWMLANDFALRLFHLEKVDYRGKTGAELIAYSPSYLRTFFACAASDEKAWSEKTPLREDQEILLPDGSSAVFDVIKKPLFQEDGSRKYLVVVGRDITKRKKMENALKEQEEHYRTLVENVPGVVFLCGIQNPWKMYYISEDVLGLTGYSQEEFIGLLPWGDLVLPEDLPHVEETVNRGLLQKNSYQVEYRIRHKDGTLRHVFEKARGIYSDGEVPLYIEGVILDITDRKRAEEKVLRLNRELEERVRERTAQLERTNRELESFAHSISHDLRTPLRAINGFSQALEEDYGHLLDEQGKNFLSRIRKGALRLDQRIRDLLGLSRISRSSMEHRDVDLSSMAKHILEDLKREEPDRAVEITVDPGVTALGDGGLLRVVLENLLDNAWKFTGRRNPGTIRFGSFLRENQQVYFVEDNGAGFDATRQEDRLFGTFQRFHEESEFPGNGIGLATVQRIIHRHGGRIWVETAPEKGATFFFTLPQKQNAREKAEEKTE